MYESHRKHIQISKQVVATREAHRARDRRGVVAVDGAEKALRRRYRTTIEQATSSHSPATQHTPYNPFHFRHYRSDMSV